MKVIPREKESVTSMNIGYAVRLARNTKRMTMTDLSKLSGIPAIYISNLENGKRQPTLAIIDKLAKAFDIHPILLLFLGVENDDIFEDKLFEKIQFLAWKSIRKQKDEH